MIAFFSGAAIFGVIGYLVGFADATRVAKQAFRDVLKVMDS